MHDLKKLKLSNNPPNKNINKIHNSPKKDLKCDSCGKTFRKTGNLEEHINSVHIGQRDHKCDSCGRAFSSSQYLKKHKNAVHTSHLNKSVHARTIKLSPVRINS